VKTAILLAAGAANADAAEKILEGTGQKLRPALSEIEGSKGR
ncbi:MAG: N-acetylmuramic acid 6-phosphate etherase, partial [Mesorhizobium sp.]